MASVTLNGAAVLEGAMRLPRVGRWWADLVVDTPHASDVTGPCALSLFGVSFQGASFRLLTYRLVTTVRLVGGMNGLGQSLAPKAYQNVPLQLPLRELLSACGENLSPATDSNVRGALLPFWSRERGPAGQALQALLGAVPGNSWRFLPDGSLWIGPETWPASLFAASVLHHKPQLGEAEVAGYVPNVFPGEFFSVPTSAASGNVGAVLHRFDATKLRTWLYFE